MIATRIKHMPNLKYFLLFFIKLLDFIKTPPKNFNIYIINYILL